MTRIFISYRREDSAETCGRLYDRLEMRFGEANVFKDVDNIPPGVDFRNYVQAAVAQCDVVLVVIGPKWLTSADSQGQQRLTTPNDFVRIEIESALLLRKVIVPVLINNATMPNETELPPSIGALAYINAVRLRLDPDFRHDCDVLMNSVARYGSASSVALTPPMTRTQPLSKGSQTTLRWLIGSSGMVALGLFIFDLILQYGIQGHTSTLTLNTLPAITIGIDLLASLIALIVAIRVGRPLWILWLILLNIFPLGFAPIVFAFGEPLN